MIAHLFGTNTPLPDQSVFFAELFSRDLYKNFLDTFALEQFGSINYKIIELDYGKDEKSDYYFLLYKIVDVSGVESSVVFSRYKEDVVYRIDCQGSCGCVEQFIPPKTFQCSCSPCSMSVTELVPDPTD
jgi:hypothetical protein